jgi:hypothetical protein
MIDTLTDPTYEFFKKLSEKDQIEILLEFYKSLPNHYSGYLGENISYIVDSEMNAFENQDTISLYTKDGNLVMAFGYFYYPTGLNCQTAANVMHNGHLIYHDFEYTGIVTLVRKYKIKSIA